MNVQQKKAVVASINGSFAFSITMTLVKCLQEDLDITFVLFTRMMVATFIAGCFVIYHKRNPFAQNITPYFVMNFLAMITMLCTYASYQKLPFKIASSLGLLGPFFSFFLSMLFFGDKVTFRKIFFLITGYIGVLMLTLFKAKELGASASITLADFDKNIIYPIIANALAASIGVATKKLLKTRDNKHEIMFLNSLLVMFFSGVIYLLKKNVNIYNYIEDISRFLKASTLMPCVKQQLYHFIKNLCVIFSSGFSLYCLLITFAHNVKTRVHLAIILFLTLPLTYIIQNKYLFISVGTALIISLSSLVGSYIAKKKSIIIKGNQSHSYLLKVAVFTLASCAFSACLGGLFYIYFKEASYSIYAVKCSLKVTALNLILIITLNFIKKIDLSVIKKNVNTFLKNREKKSLIIKTSFIVLLFVISFVFTIIHAELKTKTIIKLVLLSITGSISQVSSLMAINSSKSPGAIAIIEYIRPFIMTTIGVVVFHEDMPSILQMIGIFIVIISVSMFATSKHE